MQCCTVNFNCNAYLLTCPLQQLYFSDLNDIMRPAELWELLITSKVNPA